MKAFTATRQVLEAAPNALNPCDGNTRHHHSRDAAGTDAGPNTLTAAERKKCRLLFDGKTVDQ